MCVGTYVQRTYIGNQIYTENNIAYALLVLQKFLNVLCYYLCTKRYVKISKYIVPLKKNASFYWFEFRSNLNRLGAKLVPIWRLQWFLWNFRLFIPNPRAKYTICQYAMKRHFHCTLCIQNCTPSHVCLQFWPQCVICSVMYQP